VVLEVEGETHLAYSDLPLVRGKVLRTIVEPAGAGVRLRVRDEPGSSDGRTPSRASHGPCIASDELDLVIAEIAKDLGLSLDEKAVFDVRDRLRTMERRLEREAVPLQRLKRDVRSILILRARGLTPSPRARRALSTSADARLGTALQRLGENLRSAGRSFEGNIGNALERRGAGLERFFLDLDRPALAANLISALLGCGYGFEKELAERGIESLNVGEIPRDNLKGELLWLWSSLSEMRGTRFVPSAESARRGLERSLAWCARALDIIEGVQIQNVRNRWKAASEQEFGFQLPVVWRSLHGTLTCFVAGENHRFWIELEHLESFGLELVREKENVDVNLYLPEALERRVGAGTSEWREAVGNRMGVPLHSVRCRLIRDAAWMSVHLDESEPGADDPNAAL